MSVTWQHFPHGCIDPMCEEYTNYLNSFFNKQSRAGEMRRHNVHVKSPFYDWFSHVHVCVCVCPSGNLISQILHYSCPISHMQCITLVQKSAHLLSNVGHCGIYGSDVLWVLKDWSIVLR